LAHDSEINLITLKLCLKLCSTYSTVRVYDGGEGGPRCRHGTGARRKLKGFIATINKKSQQRWRTTKLKN